MASSEKETVRASLIDRLVDLSPRRVQEARPLRCLSPGDFKESILRDLSWLLNTRTSLPPEEYESRELTVLDYGLPDFGARSPANPDDWPVMARWIKKALTAFEPRLTQVRVAVQQGPPRERTMSAVIEAVLVVEQAREPFSFLTILHQDGTWELMENET